MKNTFKTHTATEKAVTQCTKYYYYYYYYYYYCYYYCQGSYQKTSHLKLSLGRR